LSNFDGLRQKHGADFLCGIGLEDFYLRSDKIERNAEITM